MIKGNLYSKFNDVLKDACGFAAALFISLSLLGIVALYSITTAAVILTACSVLVIFTGILILFFIKHEDSDEDTEKK